jgi:two-component system, LytTR family, response regulator
MNLRCITVDDEPLSLAKIEGFIRKVPYLTLVSSFSSAMEAMAFLKENPVDLLFLDIQMDNLTGIQMLEILDPKPRVILTTAYDQYALKGYELNVTDYLLKPFSFERFLKAVEKVNTQLMQPPVSVQKTNASFIFLKSEYRLEKVNFDDILYVESRGDYVYVILKNTKILTLMRLKNLAELLPEDRFVRVHKSYLVAIDQIDAIEHGRIRIKDSIIPIGETYRDEIWKRLELGG